MRAIYFQMVMATSSMFLLLPTVIMGHSHCNILHHDKCKIPYMKDSHSCNHTLMSYKVCHSDIHIWWASGQNLVQDLLRLVVNCDDFYIVYSEWASVFPHACGACLFCQCLSLTPSTVSYIDYLIIIQNIGSRPSDHYFRSVCWFDCLSVCLCRVFFSRLWSDFDQTRTYVICLCLLYTSPSPRD